MATALIPVDANYIGETLMQTVNARALHAFLEVGKDFSTWIKDRIEQYDFAENVDYTSFSHSPISGSGNRGAKIEYHLTLDRAKELSMVERNERGKQARRYFIECERRLHALAAEEEAPTFILPQTMPEALRLAAMEMEKREAAELERDEAQALLAVAGPKAEALDLIADAQGLCSITEASKLLRRPRRDEFIDWLIQHRWVFRRNGKRLEAHADRLHSGHMATRLASFVDQKTGEERTEPCPKITNKGLKLLAIKFRVELAA